ncbi:MAG: MOSC domain-containing protein [Flectobacillus sp.]|nr:MOSC domain-containing protein [Flectobacillus sp.]
MITLSEIWIYPIKSLGGISLNEANVTERGLEYDRRWLLVDDAGVFLTQRQYASLALFSVALTEDGFLEVTNRKSNQSLSFSTQQYSNKQVEVKVWDDMIWANEVSEEVSLWFSNQLDKQVHLVYMPDSSKRAIDPRYAQTDVDITSFADGYPFLLIGQSSLDDLNNRLESAVTMNRFRPNFVVKGASPYQEESWYEFQLGAVDFWGVKPCARCILITINPVTGERTSSEPLATLSKYRKVGNKVLFGQNVIPKSLGKLQVGDVIKVKSNATNSNL